MTKNIFGAKIQIFKNRTKKNFLARKYKFLKILTNFYAYKKVVLKNGFLPQCDFAPAILDFRKWKATEKSAKNRNSSS